ncbi:MAG: hypothetical protein Q9218_006567, partial [Villophora microphyllina]
MYLGLVGLLSTASIASARPAQQSSSLSLSLNVPYSGFPAEELPLASNDSTGGLERPLFPFASQHVSQQIVYEPGSTPPGAGSQLVANTAANIYTIWKDTENIRIRWTYETRKPPFNSYKWIVIPALQEGGGGGMLNPEKLGIVACRIMGDVINQPRWPGKITAKMFDSNYKDPYALHVGDLTIANLPEAASAPASNSTEAAVTARSQSFPDSPENQLAARAPVPPIPRAIEKAWLQCFSQLYWTVVTKSYYGNVGDDRDFPTPPPGRSWTTLRFPCGPGNRAQLLLYPAAAPTATTRLT